MQNQIERNDAENVEPISTVEAQASVEELGLEVIEDTPQLAMSRPVRHIRS
ncbi:MAG: hypothetical protein ACTHNZ_19585 [Trinickia sp.]|uniref:hypothetical protein n=1 Tax=Trinickia sp. TaxID=2571163 RepID=UPI003F81DF79